MKHLDAAVNHDQTGDTAVCKKGLKTKTKNGTTLEGANGSGVQGDTSYISFWASIQICFMEALTQQSIEESINLSDMSVVLDAVLEGFIPGHG